MDMGGDAVRIEARNDGTADAFNDAGYWIAWTKMDDNGRVRLQGTSAPLSDEERQALEERITSAIERGAR